MRLLIHEKYGSPELLNIGIVEKPFPLESEILIKVYTTTVNRTDCAMLRARPSIMRLFTGLLKPSKSNLGTDFAGVVEQVGKNVTTVEIRDRVFGFDDSGISSHAEYMIISENTAILKIPESIGFEAAAASIEGAHYAYNFINKVNLKSGQKVLVNGASGAIGSAMVQLLNYFGAHVTAVCMEKDFDLVKSIGAGELIDYKTDDFTQLNTKFDYVFDAVGKSSFNQCRSLLKKGGVYISSELGWMAQNLFYSLRTFVYSKLPGFQDRKKVIFPYPSNIKKSLLLIKELMEQGRIEPVIDRVYPFDEIIEAYKYVEKGDKLGNVIIIYDGNE